MKMGEGGKEFVAAEMIGTHSLNILIVDEKSS
jgi:hypothetical protein